VIEGRAPSITKENITGGGSVIDGKDLNRVSAATLDDAMVGKLAGANLQANSGAPAAVRSSGSAASPRSTARCHRSTSSTA